MRAAVLGLLVGLLLGFLGRGMFPDPLRASGGAAGEELEPPREVWTPVRDDGAELDLPAPRRIARQVAADLSPDAAAVLDQSELRTVVEEAALRVPRGAGTIHGVVVDEAGRGVDGVAVQARGVVVARPRSAASVGVPPGDTLEEVLREAAREYVEGGGGDYRATSGSTGEFVLDALPEGSFDLQLFKQDHVIERVGGKPSRVPLGGRVRFVARPIVDLPLSVLFADGTSAARAVISCREPGSSQRRPERYAWSRSEPVLRLPAGDWSLAALVGGAPDSRALPLEDTADQHSEPATVSLEAGHEPETLVLRLESRAGIRGRVLAPDEALSGGTPVVHLLPWPGDDVDVDALAASSAGFDLRSRTEYAFLDLEPGRYAIGVSAHQSGPIVEHRLVDVESRVARCDFQLPATDLSDFLVVRLIDGTGQPIDGVLQFSFDHKMPNSSGSSSSVRPMRTPDGSYFFGIPARSRPEYFGDTPAGTEFGFEWVHPEFGFRTVPLEPGQTELEILAEALAELDVRVLGLRGAEERERARVTVSDRRGSRVGGRYWSDEIPPGRDGVKHFELEPGSYVVDLGFAPKGQPSGELQRALASLQVEVKPGSNSAQIALPLLHAVDVQVPGAEPGEALILQRPFELEGRHPSWRGVCDEAGHARFDEVPPGEYLLTRSGTPEPNGMRVSVPTGVIVFEPGAE